MKRTPLTTEGRRAQEVRRENATAALEEAAAMVAAAAKRLAEAKQRAKDAKDALESCRACIVEATEWLELGRPDDGQQQLPVVEAEAPAFRIEAEALAVLTKRRGGGR